MNRYDILNTIKDLARSQGFYGRLLERLNYLSTHDAETYDAVMSDLESRNFPDPLDLILYFES